MVAESTDRQPGRWGPAALMGAAALVGVLIGGLIVWAVGSNDSSPSTASVCDASSVAHKTLPSIVTISAANGRSGGTGSGEVIRSDGYILTNNHVIAVAANGGTVSVLFEDGKTEPATITGRDPVADLAVLKAAPNDNAPVIPFTSSDGLKVGQPVIALGAPLGLSSTVTSGIVSALNRTVDVPADNNEVAVLASAIQTDASINPGNSGGALVNCSGELVGVPTAGATAGGTGSIGLGFAIPSDMAKTISDAIIANGSFTHSYIGVQASPAPSGLYLEAVSVNGPAARAGLRAGDVVTKIDGTQASTVSQLIAVTLTKKAGDQVEVEYTRNGQPATATITLGADPGPRTR